MHKELVGLKVCRGNYVGVVECCIPKLIDVGTVPLDLCEDDHCVIYFSKVLHSMVELLHELILSMAFEEHIAVTDQKSLMKEDGVGLALDLEQPLAHGILNLNDVGHVGLC